MHSFTTKRLINRPLEEQDKAFFCSLYTDKEIMHYIGEPLSQVDAEKTFDFYLSKSQLPTNRFFMWAIIEKSSGETIGIQCFSHRTGLQPPKSAELGLIIAKTSQGKGVATEAHGALIEYGFMINGYNKVLAVSKRSNPAPLRYLKTLGFIFHKLSISGDLNDISMHCDQETWKNCYIENILEKKTS